MSPDTVHSRTVNVIIITCYFTKHEDGADNRLAAIHRNHTHIIAPVLGETLKEELLPA